jgi:hypothetical protein
MYGVWETNPGAHDEKIEGHVDWTHPGLKVERLRLVSDPGLAWWDVSYCYGRVGGKKVSVSLPFYQLRRNHRYLGHFVKAPSLASQLVEWGKKDGVHVKSLGILDCISTLC